MRNIRVIMIVCVLTAWFSVPQKAHAERLFPSPEFTSDYRVPETQHPDPRKGSFEYIDTAVLILALAAAAYLAISARSRNGLFALTVFSAAYFGFFRQGCVCPVGAVQNVTAALSVTGYAIPLAVFLFFALPVVFAVFFGRVFCSSVCPLGALQELVIYRPLKIPSALKDVLGLMPYLYLGTAVLFAATGSGFIICRYDPFIGFYRMSGPFAIIAVTAAFLVIGVFIARPYCRFFCPYGVILGICSSFSGRHISITPGECVRCGLCRDSCPVDAINIPSPAKYKTDKEKGIKTLRRYLIAAPVVVFLAGLSFSGMAEIAAKANNTVRLAEQIRREETSGAVQTLESQAFREKGDSIDGLFGAAEDIRSKFRSGMWILGFFMGIVIMVKVINRSRRSVRDNYEPDRFNCVSCGRCMEYCPVSPPQKEKSEHA